VRPLRVAMYVPFTSSAVGGMEQYVQALAVGLGSVSAPNVNFTWILDSNNTEWLTPYLPRGHATLTISTKDQPFDKVPSRLRSALAASRPAGWLPVTRPAPLTVDLESHFDVVHFPSQLATHTSLPSIFQPHDLQHEHFGEFFTPRQVRSRRVLYRHYAHRATRIVAGSAFAKADFIRHLGVDASKVEVIMFPGPGDLRLMSAPLPHNIQAEVDRFARYERGYVLYPAAFWPHKNHRRLLDAIRHINYDANVLGLVLTGAPVDGVALTEQEAWRRAGHHVASLGYTTRETLAALYRGARALVMPSLFENLSQPVWEAFSMGIPVACSNVTDLPEQVGGAAVQFDPTSVADIVRGIHQVTTVGPSRHRLTALGYQRVSEVTWTSAASQFVQLYDFLRLNLRSEAGDR
jgi:glycosyltransferase involved in cell wall biosynthesis